MRINYNTITEVLFMNYSQLPSGFKAELFQNEKARTKFDSLSEREKHFVADRARSIGTRHEMKSFVRSLTDSTGF